MKSDRRLTGLTRPELQILMESKGVKLPFSDTPSPLFQPLGLKEGMLLANRCAAQPLEGFDSTPEGGVGELTLRRYTRFAYGGFALIWVEATAVSNQGRGHIGMLHLCEPTLSSFASLVDAVRNAAEQGLLLQQPYLVLQLHHGGRFSDHPNILFHEPSLDEASHVSWDQIVLTDEDLRQVIDDYVATAKLAKLAGFNAVDVKCCHGYLLYESLRARTREGEFGGSYENRTRLILTIVRRIRDEVGIDCAVRMDAFSGEPYPYGWGVAEDGTLDLSEPERLAAELVQEGVILLNVSNGNPYTRAYLSRPFNKVPSPPEHPLVSIERLIFCASQIQKAVGDVPVVASGFSALSGFAPSVASALVARGDITLAGWGRQAFAHPFFPSELERSGSCDFSYACTVCDGCIRLIESGRPVGCIVYDRERYALR